MATHLVVSAYVQCYVFRTCMCGHGEHILRAKERRACRPSRPTDGGGAEDGARLRGRDVEKCPVSHEANRAK